MKTCNLVRVCSFDIQGVLLDVRQQNFRIIQIKKKKKAASEYSGHTKLFVRSLYKKENSMYIHSFSLKWKQDADKEKTSTPLVAIKASSFSHLNPPNSTVLEDYYIVIYNLSTLQNLFSSNMGG